MSQGSKKKKGIALALVLLLVMSALAVVVFGKGYIRNKNRGRSPHVISASSAEQIAERIISETSLVGVVKLQNEQVGNYYGVPVAIIENSAVYKSSSALSADEIAVFRVSNEAEKKIAASPGGGRVLTWGRRVPASALPTWGSMPPNWQYLWLRAGAVWMESDRL